MAATANGATTGVPSSSRITLRGSSFGNGLASVAESKSSAPSHHRRESKNMGRKGVTVITMETKSAVPEKSDLEAHKAFLARSESRLNDMPITPSHASASALSSSSISSLSSSSASVMMTPTAMVIPSSLTNNNNGGIPSSSLPSSSSSTAITTSNGNGNVINGSSSSSSSSATPSSSVLEDPVTMAKRLRLIAIHSPQAVSLPVLMGELTHARRQKMGRPPKFFAAVVLSDISGFTALAEALANKSGASGATNGAPAVMSKSQMARSGSDTLVTIVNKIFSILIDTIHEYGGDVLKFAGDALLSIWRCSDDSIEAKTQCCVLAAKASSVMTQKMTGFVAQGVTLTLHSGLAAGDIRELHFGGHKDRWEYMVAGKPIYETGLALECAPKGDCVVHEKMWKLIKDHCDGTIVPGKRHYKLLDVRYNGPPAPDVLAELLHFEDRPERRLEVEEVLRSYIPQPVMLAIKAGKDGLIGELRQVTILFVSLPDFAYDTAEQLQRSQDAFLAIQKILARFDGTLRQFIEDDKGTVAIIVFGLPYLSHEDDPLRAVLTAIHIFKTLVNTMKMRCGIGIATGDTYCGTVGNGSRCEYAIVGDCVNLCARLMAWSKNDPIILCDGETETFVRLDHSEAAHTIRFEFKGMIKVKGKAIEIPIYLPHLQDQVDTIGQPETPMLGRQAELEEVMKRVRALRANQAGGVILLEGEAGLGKTRLIQEIVSHINTMGGNGDSNEDTKTVTGGRSGHSRSGSHAVAPNSTPMNTSSRERHEREQRERDRDAGVPPGLGRTISINGSPMRRMMATSGADSGAVSVPSSHRRMPSTHQLGVMASPRLGPLAGGGLIDAPPNRIIRWKFGVATSLTSKSAYHVWRTLVSHLLVENSGITAENFENEEKGEAKTPEPPPPATIVPANGNESKDMKTEEGSGPIITPTTATSSGAMLPGPTIARSAGMALLERQVVARAQLQSCGIPDDEHSLLNVFTQAKFKESPKVRGMAHAERIRRLNVIIIHLLFINYRKFGPLVLIIENLQWLDPFSWTVLSRLCNKVDAGVLLVLTTRPGLKSTRKFRDLLSLPHTRAIDLQPLQLADIEALACMYLKQTSLPKQLCKMVFEVSLGNPLFAKDLLRSLTPSMRDSSGRAVGTDNKTSTNTSGTSSSSSTTTSGSTLGDDISGVIARMSHAQTSSLGLIMTSRIDGLTAMQREILLVAAAVGVEFAFTIVSAVCTQFKSEEVEEVLHHLATFGFITVRGVEPDCIGRFHHTHMQSVAYQLLSKSERDRLHLSIAEAMQAAELQRDMVVLLRAQAAGASPSLLVSSIANTAIASTIMGGHGTHSRKQSRATGEKGGFETRRPSADGPLELLDADDFAAEHDRDRDADNDHGGGVVGTRTEPATRRTHRDRAAPVVDAATIDHAFRAVRSPEESTAINAQIAWHFAQAGHTLRALCYYDLAGTSTLISEDLEESLRHFNQLVRMGCAAPEFVGSTTPPAVTTTIATTAAANNAVATTTAPNGSTTPGTTMVGNYVEEKKVPPTPSGRGMITPSHAQRASTNNASNTTGSAVGVNGVPSDSILDLTSIAVWERHIGEANLTLAKPQLAYRHLRQALGLLRIDKHLLLPTPGEVVNLETMDVDATLSAVTIDAQYREEFWGEVAATARVLSRYARGSKNQYLNMVCCLATIAAAERSGADHTVLMKAVASGNLVSGAIILNIPSLVNTYYEAGTQLLSLLQNQGYSRSEELGALLNHMAGADIVLGRWTQARLHLEMAYDIHYRRESIGRQLRSMSLWAMMNRLQGHIDKSGALYTRLQQTAMEQAALRYIAYASIGYTENLVLSGRFAEALHEIGEQTKRQPVEPDVSITVRTKAAMGMAHWGQEQKDVGIRLALQSLNLINSTVIITRNYFEALSSIVAVLCLWLLDRRDSPDGHGARGNGGTGGGGDGNGNTNGDTDGDESDAETSRGGTESSNLSALGGHGPSHSLVAAIGMFTQLCGTMIVARPRLLVWRGVSLLARQAKNTRPSSDCETIWREALELARAHEMVYEQALSLYWLSRCGIDAPTGCAAIFSICFGGGEAYRRSVAQHDEHLKQANTLLRTHGLSLAALDPSLASEHRTLTYGGVMRAGGGAATGPNGKPVHEAQLRRRSLSVAGLFSQRPRPEEDDTKTEDQTSPIPGSGPGTPQPMAPATPVIVPSSHATAVTLAAPGAGAGGTNFKAIVASSPSAVPHGSAPVSAMAHSPSQGTPPLHAPGSPATPLSPPVPATAINSGKYQLPAKKSTTVVTTPNNPFTFGSANNTQVSPSMPSTHLPPPSQVPANGSGNPAMAVTELNDGLDSSRESVRLQGGTLRRGGHHASMSMDDTQVREVMRAAGTGANGGGGDEPPQGAMYSPVPTDESSRLATRRRQAFRLPAEPRMDTLDSLLGDTRPPNGTPPRPMIPSGVNTLVGLTTTTAMFGSARGAALAPNNGTSSINNGSAGTGTGGNGNNETESPKTNSMAGSPATGSSSRGRDRGGLRIRRMSFDEQTRTSLGAARSSAAAAAYKESKQEGSPETDIKSHRIGANGNNQSSPVTGPTSPMPSGRTAATGANMSPIVDSGRTGRSTDRDRRQPTSSRSDSNGAPPPLPRQVSNVKLRISIHSPNHKGSPNHRDGHGEHGFVAPIDEAEVIEEGAMTEREGLFNLEDTPPTRHHSRVRGTSPVFLEGSARSSAAVMAYGASGSGNAVVAMARPLLQRTASTDPVAARPPMIMSATAQAAADLDAAAAAALDRFIDLLPKQVLYYFLCSAFKPHNGIRATPHNSRHATLVAPAPNGGLITIPLSPGVGSGRPNLLMRPDPTLALMERSLLLSSITQRPLEGAILGVHYRLIDHLADATTTFSSINTLIGFLLQQALRHDGRLVMLNSTSLVLLWERTAQTPLLAVAKAAESCAFAMGVAINQYLNTLRRVDDLTWRSPFFIRYVISAGALMALQSPGVQASARQCTIFGTPLHDALIYAGVHGSPVESHLGTPLPSSHGPTHAAQNQIKGKHTSAAAAALLGLPQVPSSPHATVPISSIVAGGAATMSPSSPPVVRPVVNTGNGSPDSPDSPSHAHGIAGSARAIRGNVEYCGITAALVDQSSKRAESSVRRLSLRLRLRSAVAGLTAMNKLKNNGWSKFGKSQPGGGLLTLIRAARMQARAEDAKTAAMSPPVSPPVASGTTAPTSLSSSPAVSMTAASLVSAPLVIHATDDISTARSSAPSAPVSPQPPMSLAISVHPPDAVTVVEAEQAAAAAAAAANKDGTASPSNVLALPNGGAAPLSPLASGNGLSFASSAVRGSMRNTAVLSRLSQYMSSLGLIREALRLYMPALHARELLRGTGEQVQTCVLIRCRLLPVNNQPHTSASLPVLEFEPVLHALRAVAGLFPGGHAMLFPHGDSLHVTIVHHQAHKMLRLALWLMTAAQMWPTIQVSIGIGSGIVVVQSMAPHMDNMWTLVGPAYENARACLEVAMAPERAGRNKAKWPVPRPSPTPATPANSIPTSAPSWNGKQDSTGLLPPGAPSLTTTQSSSGSGANGATPPVLPHRVVFDQVTYKQTGELIACRKVELRGGVMENVGGTKRRTRMPGAADGIGGMNTTGLPVVNGTALTLSVGPMTPGSGQSPPLTSDPNSKIFYRLVGIRESTKNTESRVCGRFNALFTLESKLPPNLSESLMRRVDEGQGRLMVVSGTDGGGKSALLSLFTRIAEHRMREEAMLVTSLRGGRNVFGIAAGDLASPSHAAFASASTSSSANTSPTNATSSSTNGKNTGPHIQNCVFSANLAKADQSTPWAAIRVIIRQIFDEETKADEKFVDTLPLFTARFHELQPSLFPFLYLLNALTPPGYRFATPSPPSINTATSTTNTASGILSPEPNTDGTLTTNAAIAVTSPSNAGLVTLLPPATASATNANSPTDGTAPSSSLAITVGVTSPSVSSAPSPSNANGNGNTNGEATVNDDLDASDRADLTVRLLVYLLFFVLGRRRLVLVIQNGHWMDSSSLQAIVKICSSMSNSLTVLSTRPLTNDDESQPNGFLKALQRVRVDQIRLEALTPIETRCMIMSCLGTVDLPPSLVSYLIDKCHGHPRTIAERCGTLVRKGLRDDQLQIAFSWDKQNARALVEQLTSINLAGHGLPGSVASTEMKVARSTDDYAAALQAATISQRLILAVASVIGKPCSAATFMAIHPGATSITVLELPVAASEGGGVRPITPVDITTPVDTKTMINERSLRNDLQLLVTMEVFESSNDEKEELYVFAQDQVRDLVYTKLHVTWRERLHERAAQYYEAAYDEQRSNKPTQRAGGTTANDISNVANVYVDEVVLAHHWGLAHNLAKKMHFLREAAAKAASSNANTEALAQYEELVSLHARLTAKQQSDESSAQAAARRLIANQYRLSDLHLEMSGVCRNLGLYTRSNQSLVHVLSAVGYELSLEPNFYKPSELRGRLEVLATAARAVRQGGGAAAIALAQYGPSSISSTGSGRRGTARGVAATHSSNDGDDTMHSRRMAVRAFEKVAQNCLRTGATALGFYCVVNAVELAEQVYARASHPSIARGYALLAVYAGCYHYQEYTTKFAARADELMRDPRFPPASRATLCDYQSMHLISQGNLDGALSLLRSTQSDTPGFTGSHKSHRDIIYSMGMLQFLQGNFKAASDTFQELLDLSRLHKDSDIEGGALNFRGYLLIHSGQPKAGVVALREARSMARRGDRISPFSGFLLSLATQRLFTRVAAEQASAIANGDTSTSLMLATLAELADDGETIGGGATPSSSTAAREIEQCMRSHQYTEEVYSEYEKKTDHAWNGLWRHFALVDYYIELLAHLNGIVSPGKKPSSTTGKQRRLSGIHNKDGLAAEVEAKSVEENHHVLLSTILIRMKAVQSTLASFGNRYNFAPVVGCIVAGVLEAHEGRPRNAHTQWERAATLAREKDMLHYRGMAHYLMGQQARISQPRQRRSNLLIARAIFVLTGSDHYVTLASTALYQVSWYDLGPSLRLRLGSFNAFGPHLTRLHSEKIGNPSIIGGVAATSMSSSQYTASTMRRDRLRKGKSQHLGPGLFILPHTDD